MLDRSGRTSTGPAEPVVVICGADENYAMPLAVMLYSAAANLSPGVELHAYVLDGGFRAESRARIAQVLERAPACASLTWLQPDLEPNGELRTLRSMSSAVYLRLAMGRLLPPHVTRAIYLDSDLIVRGNLRDLWCAGTPEYPLWAAQNYRPPFVGGRLGIRNHLALGIDPAAPYFNSGVLVVDVAEWRRRDVERRARTYLHDYAEDLNYHDQEALNVVYAGSWGQLDPAWNVLTSILWFPGWEPSPFKDGIAARRRELLARPKIVHFTTKAKPWTPQCGHPMRREFLRYQQLAGCADWAAQYGTPMYSTCLGTSS